MQRQMATLGHGLVRLLGAVDVLKRRVTRGTVGDEALRSWLQPWLARTNAQLPLGGAGGALLVWDEECWRVVSVSGADFSTEWAVVLMLLHLPALRLFWQTALRASRLRRLRQVLPRVWPLDPTIVPAGAVIGGLGITSWDQLAKVFGEGRSFRAMPLSEVGGQVIPLGARAENELRSLLPRIGSERWLLAEVPVISEQSQPMELQWSRDETGRVSLSTEKKAEGV